MASVFLSAGKGTGAQAASVSNYTGIGIGFWATNPTETSVQTLFRLGGTLSGLYIRVQANDRGASTFKTRKGAVNGNGAISIGSSTTGEFQDTVNTDTVTAADKWAWQLTTGAGGTTFVTRTFGSVFAATTDTMTQFTNSVVTAYTAASTTNFHGLAGNQTNGITTESLVQYTMRAVGTLKNMCVNVTANARATATTVNSRKGSVNGTLTVSIGASTTGFLEDTTHSDTVASGDKWNTSTVTGTGTSSLTIGSITTEFVSTAQQWENFITSDTTTGSSGLTPNLTEYYALVGGFIGDVTESNIQVMAGVPYTAKNLRINVSANTISATSTLRFRKNGANGNQVASITASTSGVFEDSTNSDLVLATDEVNGVVTTGGTGTSMTFFGFGVTATFLNVVSVFDSSTVTESTTVLLSNNINTSDGLLRFFDNFSSNTIANYTTTGTWTISGGVLSSSTSSDWANDIVLTNESDFTDIDVLVRLKKGSANDMVAFRSGNTAGSGYGVQLRSDLTGTSFRLEIWGSASLQEVNSGITWVTGNFYWVRVHVFFNHIQARVWNDTAQEPSTWNIDYTDNGGSQGNARFLSGSVGFANENNTDAQYSYLAVTVPPTEVAPPTVLETHNINVSDSSTVTNVVVAIDYPPNVFDASTVTESVTVRQIYNISVVDLQQQRGVNMSGLEQGSTIPGVLTTDFNISAQTTYDYFGKANKGFNVVRLPILWERIQPTIGGTLDSTYAGYVDAEITKAANAGMQTILDLHNFGQRIVRTDGGFTSTFSSTPDYHWSGGSQTSGSPGYLEVNNFQTAIGGSPNNPTGGATTYTFQTDATLISNGGSDVWRSLWLQAFSDGNNNFLFFDMSNTNSHWEVGKRVNGTDTILASGTQTFTLGTAYTVLMDVGQGSAGNLVVKLNGSTLATVAIPSGFTNGYVGAFANGVDAKITNVTLNVNGDTTGSNAGTGLFKVGSSGLTTANFSDLWKKIATRYASNNNVLAYDLMNEAHDMPTPTTSSNYNTTATVTVMDQAAITAIRQVDTTHFIIAEIDAWAGAQTFVTNYGSNPTPWWTDPSGRLIYSFHYYFDDDHSGSYALAFKTSNNTAISGDVSPIMSWAQTNGLLLFCGEYGVPNIAAWQVCLTTFLDLCNTYSVWTVQWAAGDAYVSPVTSMQPTGTSPSFVDALQMATVGYPKYTGGTRDIIFPMYNSNVFDASTLTESTTVRLTPNINVSDSSTVTDVLVQDLETILISLADSSTVTELATMLEFENINVFDASTITESTTVTLPSTTLYSVSVFDSSTVTDVISNIGFFLNVHIDGSGSTTKDQHQDSVGSSFGFGEFANARYRGQIFTPSVSGTITTLGFNRDKGSQGIKAYFDTVTSNAPTHAAGSELYSFTITNANVIDQYGEYTLPTPLSVTSGTAYCFYLAPWNTSTDSYSDDYHDCHGIASAPAGLEITNTNGTWSTENLTFNYAVYISSGTSAETSTITDVLSQPIEIDLISVSDSSAVTESTTVTVSSNNPAISVFDSSAVTESTTVLEIDTINVSDSSAVTESTTILLIDNISVFDSSAVTDVLSQILEIHNINVNDTSTVTESVTITGLTVGVSVSDSSTVTDALTIFLTNFVNVFDSSAVTENTTAGEIHNLSVFDSSAVTNVITQILEIHNISVFDASTVLDVIVQDLENENVVVTADTSAVTEFVSVVFALPGISVFDSSAVTDVLTQILEIHNLSVFDTSAVTEVVTMLEFENVSVFDSSAVTDSTTVVQVDNISVFDASAATDVLSQILETHNVSVFDSSAVTDSVTLLGKHNLSVFDSSAATDVPTVIESSNISVFDSSVVTDVLLQALEIDNISVFDSSAATDAVTVIVPNYYISVFDSSAVTENVAINNTVTFQVNVSDSSTVTNVLTQILEISNISVFDSSVVTDVIINDEEDCFISVVDSSTVTESTSVSVATPVGPLSLSVFDSSTVVDKVFYYDDTVITNDVATVQEVLVSTLSVSDSSTATDALIAIYYPPQVSDSSAATDALIAIYYPPQVSDSSSITDVVSLLMTGNISVFDSSTVTDVLIQDLETNYISVADISAVTEAVTVVPQVSGVSTFDSSIVTDALVAIYYPPQVSDSSTVTDVLTQVLMRMNISVFDSSTVTEVLVQDLETMLISLADSSAVTETVTVTLTIPGISVSDSSTVTDVITKVALANAISVFDSSAVTDVVIQALESISFSISDSSALTDVLLLDYYNETYTTTPKVGSLQNNASWSNSGYVVLTTATNNQQGQVSYNGTLPSPLEIIFDFWTGGGSGADAVFAYWGNSRLPTSEDDTTAGYVVAYDEYSGDSQPIQIKFNGTTIANTTGSATFADSAWHTAKITLVGTTVTAYLDGVQQVQFTDSTRTLGGTFFGLGARTGGINNEHRVRIFRVSSYNDILETNNLSVSDSSAVTDALIYIVYPPAVSDASVVTDVVSQILQTHNILVSDSSSVTDVIIQDLEQDYISLAESSAVTESSTVIVTIPGLVVSDSSTVTDSLVQILEVGNITVFDSSAITESSSVLEITTINVSDASAVTDVVSQVLEICLISDNDSSAVTDVITRILIANAINVFDASAVFEQTISVVLPNYYVSVFDSSAVTDTVSQVLATNTISVFDSSVVTENVVLREDLDPSVFDQSSLSELVTMLLTGTISVVDSSTVTEVPTLVITNNLSVSDSSTITDVVGQVLEVDNISVGEDSTVLDVVLQESEDEDAVVADVTTVTDVPTVILTIPGIVVSDSSTITDVLSQILETSNLSVFDSSTATDVVVQVLQITTINTFETSNITDSSTVRETSNLSVFDSSTVTDVATNLYFSTNLIVSDTSAVTENIVAREDENSVVFDTSTVTDSQTLVLVANISLFDASTVTDVVLSDQENENIVVTDASTVTDVPTVSLTIPGIVVSDSSPVTDARTIGFTNFVSVSDSSTVTDVVIQEQEDVDVVVFDSSIVTTVIVGFAITPLYISVSDSSTLSEFLTAIGNTLAVVAFDQSTVTETLNGQNGGIYLNPIDLIVSDTIGIYQFIFVDGRLAMRLFSNFYTLV